jgi:vitamin B12 transporter
MGRFWWHGLLAFTATGRLARLGRLRELHRSARIPADNGVEARSRRASTVSVHDLRGSWLGHLLSSFPIMLYLNSVRVAPGVRSAWALVPAVACGVVPCLPGLSWAEEAMEPVMVTATRTPSRISDLVADVTVIDRAAIQASVGLSTASFLAQLPGIQISSNGGIGASSNVFVRGGDARHTLLLVDGMRMGSATTGTPSLENLPLDQIERIEIVRGPMAALYGADAAAGVIQVFTRRGREGVQTQASLTLGSHDFRAGSAGVSGGSGNMTYSVQASTQATAGFDATTSQVPLSNHNPDSDGFRQRALSLSAGYAFTQAWKVEGRVLRSEAVNSYDDGVRAGGVTPDTEREQLAEVGSLKVTGKIGNDWQTALTWSHSVDKGETTIANKPTSLSMIRTRQAQWTWENQIATSWGTGLVALEQLRQAVTTSRGELPVQSRTIHALVLGLAGERGRHVWQMSARNDWNSQFGREATGSAAYGFDVLPAWRAGASIGTSFVAPTFNQLYNPENNFGDATLQPERGTNRELSLRWLEGAHTAKLIRFDNRVRGYIQSGRVGGFPKAVAIPRVEMTGWTLSGETTGDVFGGKLNVGAALDLLDASRPDTGKKLRQRADTVVSLNADLTRGALRYAAYLKANDGSYGDDTNTSALRLPVYVLSGASLDWAFEPGWRLGFKVDNLSDKRYQTAYGYQQPRRQFMVTMSHASR